MIRQWVEEKKTRRMHKKETCEHSRFISILVLLEQINQRPKHVMPLMDDRHFSWHSKEVNRCLLDGR